MITNMQQQSTGNKAQALTVADLSVIQGVCLEYVVQRQLASAKVLREVRVMRKRPT